VFLLAGLCDVLTRLDFGRVDELDLLDRCLSLDLEHLGGRVACPGWCELYAPSASILLLFAFSCSCSMRRPISSCIRSPS